jgi:uncharacterized cupredoxin-like copper-binding protein
MLILSNGKAPTRNIYMKKAMALLLLNLLPSLSFADGGHSSEKTIITGMPGNESNVSRTINVDMGDNMRFTPSLIKVKTGETIRFIVKNSGQLHHELVIGDIKALQAHAEMMRKMPDMQHKETNMVSLDHGQTGTIIWKFEQTANIDFACLIPGHWEAGMMGVIEVNHLKSI